MPRTWTAEQRRAQSEKIRQQKPWTRSTGPKTTSGKAKSGTNALKTDSETLILRSIMAELNFALRLHDKFLQNLEVIGQLEEEKRKILQNELITFPPQTGTKGKFLDHNGHSDHDVL